MPEVFPGQTDYDHRRQRLRVLQTTPPQKPLLYGRQHGRCFFCRDRFELDELTFDHFFPRGRGGENNLANKVLACDRCNNNKGDTWPTALEIARHAALLEAIETFLVTRRANK